MIHTDQILLVDDEVGILKMIQVLLQKEGFSHVYKATTGQEALRLIEQYHFDVIVLDVMLPDYEGYQLCQLIRTKTLAPILFVTARDGDLDKLTGLSVGGDDYITKPFSPLELVARIQVQLRRYRMLKEFQKPITKDKFQFERFELNREAGTLTIDRTPIHCTAKELELLSFFCTHPNQVFTTSQLYERVWGTTIGDEKTVVIHIAKLRKKIEIDPKKPEIFVNLRGIGYKFIPPKERTPL